ncbi:G patch domain and ankyrin repeat-containing protein 1 [Apophysomyces sp. BC1034]|nr:G patch domain and ankyrin repeat-containing protein 1 [Apophysomyces sp. BC1015]KAG0182245.1 G patch domain and ankyrin repeat-containing protein 1 [Apophysomyces sp. BC1021]KAG0191397.1 G patch domain and ankyrin repeat-containing protein 1 [Apophysomyces sp. BC1034]
MTHRTRLSQPIQFVASSSKLKTIPEKKSNGDAVAAFYKTTVAPDKMTTSQSPTLKINERWCETCALAVPSADYDRHVRGTAHLVSADTLPPPDVLVLNATNVGFKMLRANGWEYEQGLGASGQGRRHPVATVLKQDRRGIGCPGDRRKRVTHRHSEIERNARAQRLAERARQPLSGKEIARRDREESQKRTALLHYMNR